MNILDENYDEIVPLIKTYIWELKLINSEKNFEKNLLQEISQRFYSEECMIIINRNSLSILCSDKTEGKWKLKEIEEYYDENTLELNLKTIFHEWIIEILEQNNLT